MTKYTAEYRQQLVDEYLAGRAGVEAVAARNAIDYSMLRRWIASFKAHGAAGLRAKFTSYDVAFKIKVLRTIRSQALSHRDAAAKFDIRTVALISKWKRQYEAGGIDALAPRPRGRPSSHSPMKSQTLNGSSTDTRSVPSSSDLSYENTLLQTQIAYMKAAGQASQTVETLRLADKAAIVRKLRDGFPLSTLLRVSGLARSTYYYHMKSVEKPDRYTELKQEVSKIYQQHKGRYGYRRITASIRQAGRTVNHKLIQRLMRNMKLKSIVRRKRYTAFRGPISPISPNLLDRQFAATRPNEKWVTDVTEFNVRGSKLFLSPIMDLFNGEIVSYHMDTRPSFALVNRMFKKAMARLDEAERPLIHSDQGWQYQMAGYRDLLSERGLTQSMSRRGNCLDNAAMESFFATLKSELFHVNEFVSVTHLRHEVMQYIRYYNHDRIKLKLNGLSPVQYRQKHMDDLKIRVTSPRTFPRTHRQRASILRG